MTAQIPDRFLYKNDQYELVNLTGERLITPQDYGMNPEMLHTACYRGFYSTYEITDEALFLTEMTIGDVEGGYQPIQKILPTLPDAESHGYPTYQGLKLLTPFTGTILLGKDFIQEKYIHAGYPQSNMYTTLLEFVFNKGKLVSVNPISHEGVLPDDEPFSFPDQ